jgi:hypothetical protein
MNTFLGFFKEFFQALREINAKYKTPRIKMTPMVSFWLLMLRLYLIGMVLLLFYKFYTLIAY